MTTNTREWTYEEFCGRVFGYDYNGVALSAMEVVQRYDLESVDDGGPIDKRSLSEWLDDASLPVIAKYGWSRWDIPESFTKCWSQALEDLLECVVQAEDGEG